MGARLNIKLAEFIHHPNVKVEVSTIYHEPEKDFEENEGWLETTARVDFLGIDKQVYIFDVDVFDGGISLSRDFNFFRYPEENHQLIKVLFENGIAFHVVP